MLEDRLGRELLGGEGDVVRSRRNMKCPHVKFVNDLRVHAIIDKLAIVLSHDPTNDQGGFCLIRDLSYVARNELLNGAFIRRPQGIVEIDVKERVRTPSDVSCTRVGRCNGVRLVNQVVKEIPLKSARWREIDADSVGKDREVREPVAVGPTRVARDRQIDYRSHVPGSNVSDYVGVGSVPARTSHDSKQRPVPPRWRYASGDVSQPASLCIEASFERGGLDALEGEECVLEPSGHGERRVSGDADTREAPYLEALKAQFEII